jgi:hypothetical protein
VVFCEVAAVLSRDDTLVSAVVRNNSDRIAKDLAPASLNTAAYSNARSRVPLEIFEQTTKSMALKTAEMLAPDEFWGGMIPFAIDGTTLTADDTSANQNAFPQHGQQKEGVGFPIIRMVLLQCLTTGMVHDLAFGPCKGKETGEMALARAIVEGIPSNSILLGDCYFPSYFFLATMMSMGIHGLFPKHFARDVDFGSV